MKKDRLALFLDTNSLLHYPPLTDVDWCTVCGADSVTLIFCLQVVHELDEKKSDRRLSDRASRVIKDIKTIRSNGGFVRENVELEVFNHELKRTDFADTLSPDSKDDRIVHFVKKYVEQTGNDSVAVYSEDLGMSLRCGAHGIPIVEPGKATRLENPQTEQDKKHKAALIELSALKNRLPRLSLSLVPPDRESQSPPTFELADSWQPLDIDTEMERIKDEHPMQAGLQAQASKMFGGRPVFGSQENWNRYDKELDAFYEKYREYLDLLNAVGDAKSRSISFNLWLINDGNALANDIDVVLRFPTNLRWIAENGSEEAAPLEKELEAPKPPEAPKPFDFGGPDRLYDLVSQTPDFTNHSFVPRDDWTPDVSVHKQDDETFEVHVQLGKLKHGHDVFLGQFLAVFTSWTDVKPCQVAYTMSATDLADKIEDQLPLIARMRVRPDNE